ncbi:type II toxin-antitoxin system PemK/MazF family toxin [Patescibacteria group bacterium]|nr:type II toxin-antitoxin system PemK/MazF family toxin [Candidatus Falkowbacteria bacterium]MBU3906453.1 type II toxin-antitoxin system PemK/MazF family toxin [Patescibacteria group bacterium]MCG2698539.1 type II toxin-antitoxin system PemK/MazF family toxin [Candidatus Parcubacteria bacterium]MBU4014737.1 type II toxin-antitoxin system PemK/MazF family toxin [Patescibacteria group bacterium]MBU4027089.1 type II toxin-antitoxin system PemK/MazF family toxin [Patescibacteria group bacterium]
MIIRQGDIYLADLNPIKGHEQAGFRPVLIMQNNILNSNLNTAIIAPITSNLKAKGKLTTYFLSKNISGLGKDSIILLFQIRILDKRRLQKKVISLNKGEFLEIKNQLRFIF